MSTGPSPPSPFRSPQRPPFKSHFARPTSPILRLASARAIPAGEGASGTIWPSGGKPLLGQNAFQAQGAMRQPRWAQGAVLRDADDVPTHFPVFPSVPPCSLPLPSAPRAATAGGVPAQTPHIVPANLGSRRRPSPNSVQAKKPSASTHLRRLPSPIAVTEGSTRSYLSQVTFCTVCAATETPEWRKGPAGIRSLCNGCGLLAAKRQRDRGVIHGQTDFTSVESILEELEHIGRERFKVKGGRYHLPPGVIQKVIDMMENPPTPNTPMERGSCGRRPRSRTNRGGSGDDIQGGGGGATGDGRRASTGTAAPWPRPAGAGAVATRTSAPVRSERRSGSLGSAHSGYPSNVGDATAHAFPPSSSYMAPPGGYVSASPFTFSTGLQSGVPTQTQLSSGRYLNTTTRPVSAPGETTRGSLIPNLARHPVYSTRAMSPFARPASALATSADRMNIDHLTTSSSAATAAAAGVPPSPPRFEMPKLASEIRLSVPTSALRRSSAAAFPRATVSDMSHARMEPTT